jgi:hypothetical protein
MHILWFNWRDILSPGAKGLGLGFYSRGNEKTKAEVIT